MHSDMEYHIHILEQEAYGAVLRAFKAQQSDGLTWEKEGLITELRKELRVSDDEHRQLLSEVNADGLIHGIREWRKAGGSLDTTVIPQTMNDQLLSPKVTALHKRQKTTLSVQLGAGSMASHPQSISAAPQPLLSTKWAPSGVGGRRPQPIPPENIQWIVDDPGISQQTGNPRQGLGGNTHNAGRGRGSLTDQPENEVKPSQNDVVKKVWDEIKILRTDKLIEKVEEVVSASHPDVLVLSKAKKMLKEHEQTLINVIAYLSDACDGGRDVEQQHLHRQPAGGELGRNDSSSSAARRRTGITT